MCGERRKGKREEVGVKGKNFKWEEMGRNREKQRNIDEHKEMKRKKKYWGKTGKNRD